MNEVMKNRIYAKYSNEVVRVYQAYNDVIADQALDLQTFGDKFSMSRMTWIKPSFLWMMYRAGWATKEGQNRILAIDIKKYAFDSIVKQAVLSTYDQALYETKDNWSQKLKESEVRCQWDPDRDIYGNPLTRRAIQLGIKGNMVESYVKEWICSIEDITPYVFRLRRLIEKEELDDKLLPEEREYRLVDPLNKVHLY